MAGEIYVLYKKINIELVVAADDAQAVVTELNTALDRMDDRYTLFGGQFEAVPFEHRETRKRSALGHTIAAGESVADALRTTRKSIALAVREVVG